MRLSRFRLRTLLILVALTGIGVWGCMMWRRSVNYRRLADLYDRLEILAKPAIEACRVNVWK
jgi:hypothetical protein